MAEKIRRADFSDSLVHLTRERREYSSDDFVEQTLLREVSAFDVLVDRNAHLLRGGRFASTISLSWVELELLLASGPSIYRLA